MNIKLLAIALMVAGTTAGCSDALDRNLNILEGKDTPPEEQQEPTPDASPANPNPIPILEEPAGPRLAPNGVAYGGPCNPATDSVFRVATCSDDGILYELDSNMNWIVP